MEAATPLPFSQVRVVGDTLRVDGLVVRDECAVRLVAEHDDPARIVGEAIEIGARILDREQTGAGAETIKVEMAEAGRRFTEHATRLAERMDQKVEAVFSAENGDLSRLMARHFGDESNVAVQHRIKALLAEASTQMREDLRKQLTADSEENPIVAIQRASLKVVRDNAAEQGEHLRLMAEKLEAMKMEVAGLRAEKEKLEEIAAVEEKGTAKGRTYEEAVFAALEEMAGARGDDCEAVGDASGAAGRKGDVLISIGACAGPCQGTIVFEAKDERSLSRNKALTYLDASLSGRDADYAVLVTPPERLPAKTHPLKEFNGDKLFITFDPEDGSLGLEVAYGLARARVLMRRGNASGLDVDAVHAEVERAEQDLEAVRRIKSQLTGATNGIEEARKILETMAASVRAHLTAIDGLIAAAAVIDEAA